MLTIYCFGILNPAGFVLKTTLHLYGEWIQDATSSSYCTTSCLLKQSKLFDQIVVMSIYRFCEQINGFYIKTKNRTLILINE